MACGGFSGRPQRPGSAPRRRGSQPGPPTDGGGRQTPDRCASLAFRAGFERFQGLAADFPGDRKGRAAGGRRVKPRQGEPPAISEPVLSVFKGLRRLFRAAETAGQRSETARSRPGPPTAGRGRQTSRSARQPLISEPVLRVFNGLRLISGPRQGSGAGGGRVNPWQGEPPAISAPILSLFNGLLRISRAVATAQPPGGAPSAVLPARRKTGVFRDPMRTVPLPHWTADRRIPRTQLNLGLQAAVIAIPQSGVERARFRALSTSRLIIAPIPANVHDLFRRPSRCERCPRRMS